MKAKINIGVLGCANIAKRFMIPTLNELSEHFNLIGVASRAENKANSFAEKFNTKAFFDYDSLINSENINAVYIPLPNSLHYEWIKKALSQGLHVLVEKSLACTFEEVVELNELAKKNNLVLFENFQFRFHSQLQHIKELLAEGKIGELRNIRSSFGFPPFPDKTNIRYNKELGGGALLDAGTYPIKISQIFLGSDLYIDSASLYEDAEKGVDIWGSAYIKQKSSKVTSQIAFGFDNYYQNTIELWGSKGKISANRIFTAPPGYQPSIKLETNNGSEVIEVAADHHFKNMLVNFYSLINDKKELQVEYQKNINQARLIKELREKANEQ